MNKILIKNASVIGILDEDKKAVYNGWIEIEGNKITGVGDSKSLPVGNYDRIIDAKDKIVIPGLVNTHHHFYQTLTRAYRKACDSKLFDWLVSLYPVWSGIDDDAVYLACQIACAEMMLSGCTMTTDHHYLFPKDFTKLIDAQIEAVKPLGIRFHPTRGSMSLSEKDGGLPPDIVVQEHDTILRDSERLITQYHDAEEASMLRIALAPCSPFSVTKELMRDTAQLAEKHNVLLHTHLAETIDEEEYCLKTLGARPVDYLEDVGWLNDRTWLAHGIFFSDEEINRLGSASVGVAHCPNSNMRLGSGICKVNKLIDAGVRVGIAVDGSASNDSSHMLAEVRQAMLLSRVKYGADSMPVSKALRIATRGGASVLGRNDVGEIKAGQCADLAIFSTDDIGFSGADDLLSSLLLCRPTRVEMLIVNGNIRIENGRFIDFDLEPAVAKHREKAKRLVSKL